MHRACQISIETNFYNFQCNMQCQYVTRLFGNFMSLFNRYKGYWGQVNLSLFWRFEIKQDPEYAPIGKFNYDWRVTFQKLQTNLHFMKVVLKNLSTELRKNLQRCTNVLVSTTLLTEWKGSVLNCVFNSTWRELPLRLSK